MYCRKEDSKIFFKVVVDQRVERCKNFCDHISYRYICFIRERCTFQGQEDPVIYLEIVVDQRGVEDVK
jgi:hypothetical protein